MAAGKITLQANDGKTLSLVAPEGMVANTTDVVATTESPTFTGTPTVNGVAFSGYSGFKNYIINGNFDVWQYGTSQTSSGYGSDDRWSNPSSGSTKTHSQVVCTDTEKALFNASFFSRTVVSSVAGVNNYAIKSQKIENILKLAGKTVTFSFWAKADSNRKLGVSSEMLYGSGGSPSSELTKAGIQQVLDLTSTWNKFTITVALPTAAGKTIGTDGVHTTSNQITFWFDVGSTLASNFITGMIQQSGTFDIAQVQLEEGSIATPFEQRPYGLELSLCQRYAWYSNESILGMINVYPAGAQQVGTNIKFPQTMRVAPSVSVTSDTAVNQYYGITKNQVSVLQTVSPVGAPTITSVSASAEL